MKEWQQKKRLGHHGDSEPYDFRNTAVHVCVFGRQENTSKRQTGHGKEAYKNCKQQSLNFWVSQNFFIEEDV